MTVLLSVRCYPSTQLIGLSIPDNDVNMVLRVRETDCMVACQVPRKKKTTKEPEQWGKIQRAGVLRTGKGQPHVLQSNNYLLCARIRGER